MINWGFKIASALLEELLIGALSTLHIFFSKVFLTAETDTVIKELNNSFHSLRGAIAPKRSFTIVIASHPQYRHKLHEIS